MSSRRAEEADGRARHMRARRRGWRGSSLTVPNTRKVPKMPSEKPKSPTRLTTKGLDRGAALADWACSTRSRSAGSEARPTPSQPKNIWTRLSAVTSISIAKVNSEVGEEARLVRVLGHIAPAVEVDERRHGGDDDEHHRGQRVDRRAATRSTFEPVARSVYARHVQHRANDKPAAVEHGR